MKLENEFTVPAGIDQAWQVLLDVERVAPCLPGAAVEPGGDDGEFNGTMTVKIGPITARYKGSVRIQEADEPNRRAVMRAQAKDARGQGTAAATITSTMEEAAEGTKVKVVTDMRITGPAAQFGRGVMQDVSAKMMRQFADCLAQEMQRTPAAAPSGAEPTGGEAVAGGPVPGDQTAAPVDTGAAEAAGIGESAGGTASAGGEVPAGTAASASPAGGGSTPRPTPEVLDLGEVSRDAVLKRAAPVVGAALLLLILLRIIRR